MVLTFFKNTLILTLFICFSCGSGNKPPAAEAKEDTKTEVGNGKLEDQIQEVEIETPKGIVVGANQISEYIDLLKDKNVGIVANQTSMVDSIHLVDFLLAKQISIKQVFAPEHGFRGKADAGEDVKDDVDAKTGLPIFSLHGKNKKPTPQQMKGIDVLLFDIQGIGVRFYTYLSTLHYVMEACAESNLPLIILDRPDPNAHYVDGPIMEPENTSFLGMHPVPLVYGMTIGEYAQMINGEGWLKDKMECDLTVIPVKNYNRQMPYSLSQRPSPNIPNDVAISLYPSLGLLEGTNLNAGRGTEMQFQVFGSPYLPIDKYSFTYTPAPNFGSKNPKFKGVECHGLDLRNTPRMDKLDLTWIIEAYHNYEKKSEFFNTKNFTAHAGTAKLQKQIEQGFTYREIRKTWLQGLADFDKMRQPYLLYE